MLEELILLAILFGLPFLQQLLEGLTGRDREPPTRREAEPSERPQGGESAQPGPELGEDVLEPVLTHDEHDEWLAGAEQIAAESVVDEEDALELDRLQRRLEPEAVPEAVRVSAPVVSMEALTVDREAERARLRRRIDVRPDTPAARPPSHAPLRPERRLRSREELRRAVVLAEILGKPASLRDELGIGN